MYVSIQTCFFLLHLYSGIRRLFSCPALISMSFLRTITDIPPQTYITYLWGPHCDITASLLDVRWMTISCLLFLLFQSPLCTNATKYQYVTREKSVKGFSSIEKDRNRKRTTWLPSVDTFVCSPHRIHISYLSCSIGELLLHNMMYGLIAFKGLRVVSGICCHWPTLERGFWG